MIHYEVLYIGPCKHCGTKGVGIVGIIDARAACASCAHAAISAAAPEPDEEPTRPYPSNAFRAALAAEAMTRIGAPRVSVNNMVPCPTDGTEESEAPRG